MNKGVTNMKIPKEIWWRRGQEDGLGTEMWE